MIPMAGTAMIMAGGKGERMQPLTRHIPKPLLPICNKPPIVQTIEQIYHTAGVSDFCIKVHYLAGVIQTSLGYGDQFGSDVRIRYLVENPQLYTAGGVKRMFTTFEAPKDRPFWVLSADIFSPETDLGDMARAHEQACARDKNIMSTVSFKLMPLDEVVGRFGVAVVDKSGLVTQFFEKPKNAAAAKAIFDQIEHDEIRRLSDEAKTPLLPVNASHYLFQGRVFDEVPQTRADTQWDFGADVFPALLGRINAYFLSAPWSDVGYPEDFWRAQWYFMKVARSSVVGQFIKNWGHIGRGVINDEATKSRMKDVVIGNNARLENCVLERTVIGEGCHLKNVTVRNSVVLPFTYVNLRSNSPIEAIENSIVGGRLHGGTFIDGYSLPGRNSISREMAVPNIEGSITTEQLNLDEADIEQANHF
jgi:NDP-sugar pyrophosphorylase family protein